MEPENHPLGKENHLQNLHFLGSMLNFRGCKPYMGPKQLYMAWNNFDIVELFHPSYPYYIFGHL